MSPPPRANRRAFLIGFFASITVCAIGLVVFALACDVNHFVPATVPRLAPKVSPPRIDLLDAARQRLIRAAGKSDSLVFPFPNPRLRVCKEYRELDLYSGERFVKRYHLAQSQTARNDPRPGAPPINAADLLPEGTFYIVNHPAPEGAAPPALPLSATRPGQPAPAPAAAPATFSIHAPAAKPAPPAAGIELAAGELLELFAATAPGAAVVIEK